MSMESLWDRLPAELQQEIYFRRWQAALGSLHGEIGARVQLAVPLESGTMLKRDGDRWCRSYLFQFPHIHLVWGLWYQEEPRVAYPLNYVASHKLEYKNMGYTTAYYHYIVTCDRGAEVKCWYLE